MRTALILGTAALGAIAIQWLVSKNKRPNSIEYQMDEKVHQLQGKFRNLDEVQLAASETGGNNSGYQGAIGNPAHS